jgi:tetratricopeptide (TPR) repeat protein
MRSQKVKTRHYLIGLMAVSTLCSGPLFAAVQDDPQTNNNDEDIENITVTARAGDAAMQAFNAGNFELAEIKFKENERCALRVERNRQAFIEGVRESQISQEVNGGGVNTGSSMTDSNAARVEGNSSMNAIAAKTQKAEDKVRENTCENRAFQIYMAGMSQLQLGRAEDAEASFERAVALSQIQYDAHYRLALMKLLRQDKSGAEGHLEAINSILKRCYNCDAREEIVRISDFLQKAVDGKIKLN